MKTMDKYHKGAGLIELVIVVTIIGILGYFVFRHMTANPALDPETKKTLAEHGIDTSSYGTIINSTRSTVNDISNKTSAAIDSAMEGIK